MRIQLNDEQLAAIEAGLAVEVTEGPTVFVVLSKVQFDRMRECGSVEDIDPSLYEFTEIEMHGQPR
jgi:hypothetical protein